MDALMLVVMLALGGLWAGAARASGPPDPPTAVSARAGDGAALVRWSAPVNTGQALVTRYAVTASPGGAGCATTGSPPAVRCTVTGLADDTAYTFSVTATTAYGTSAPSAASVAVTPRAGVTGLNLLGDAGATVKWSSGQVAATSPPGWATSWPNYVYNYSMFAGHVGQTYQPAGISCSPSWVWTQILCDPQAPAGPTVGSKDDPDYVYKPNSNAGFTVDSVSSTVAYVVVDLGQARDFTTLRVFQMFSDGKVTRAAIAVIPETGSTWPAWNDAAWSEVAQAPVGTGNQVTNGGRLFTTCPTTLDFGATRSRYVRLAFSNSGEFGNPSWIEVGGAKLFFEGAPPTTTTGCPPAPPTDASAAAGNTTATVGWTPGGGTADGFDLQVRDVTASGSWQSATTDPATVGPAAESVLVTGLTNGHQYEFRVRALSAGLGNSPYSSPSAPVTPDNALPNPPVIVTVEPGSGAVRVTWDPSAGATSYTVTGAPGGSCTSTGTSCVVTGLTPGLTYTFTVTAENGAGSSGPSSISGQVVPAALPSPPPSPPASPSGVGAVAGEGSAVVSWSAVTGATSYTVTGSPGGSCTTTGTSCTVTGLVAGLPYTFTVTATGGTGTSEPSAPTAAVTPYRSADAPAGPPVRLPVARKAHEWTRRSLRRGPVVITFPVEYRTDGRFSFFLQTPAGSRVPLLPGTRVGRRVLRTVFWAPVVQDGRAGVEIPFRARVGRVPPGTVLRVILRHPDGSLEGVDLPV